MGVCREEKNGNPLLKEMNFRENDVYFVNLIKL